MGQIQPPQARAVDPQELERNAFNFAFSELGLCWYWDEKTYAELLSIAAEADRLLAYVQSQQRHLLCAYDPDFLVDAIRTTKMRYFEENLGLHADH